MTRATKAGAVAILRNIGSLLEYRGENSYKVRAYENAARALAAEPAALSELLEPRRLEQIPGIGKATAEIIREIAEHGKSNFHDELAANAPSGIAELLRVPGLGIKRIRSLYESFGVEGVDDLERLCREGALAKAPGCTQKTADKILEGIEKSRRFSGRILLAHALIISKPLLESMRKVRAVEQAEIVGSLRRRCETVGDINLIASVKKGKNLLQSLDRLSGVMQVVSTDATRTVLRLDRGFQADVRVVSSESFVPALFYYTGNREHVKEVQNLATRKGFELTDTYLKKKSGRKLELESESDIYRALEVQFIEPELREDLGELTAAAKQRLPSLISINDYQGVLHCHTNWSDGSGSIKEMAEAARKQWGFKYFAVCDHSELASYAGGVKRQDLRSQHEEIDEVNQELKATGITVLKGCECDILADGSLDYEPEYLEPMDLVVASVHSRFKSDREQMTRRLIKAIESPYTTMIGHLSGRLLLSRDPYEFDLDAILKRAGETGTAIELNADPHRLDIDWRFCRKAKEYGVIFSINPDAHSIRDYEFLHYGISMARKGWLEPGDVINCLPLDAFLDKVRSMREKKKQLLKKRQK